MFESLKVESWGTKTFKLSTFKPLNPIEHLAFNKPLPYSTAPLRELPTFSMSNSVALKASARLKDANVKDLRKAGQVPVVVYGNKQANTMLHIEEVALNKAHLKAGESTLVELDVDGKIIPALFHAVDLDPVSDRIIHVDFYAVDMKKEVEAEVHIRYENESPVVKDGAILVNAMHEILVQALPSKLPHDLALDLSKLTEMGGTLTVADIVAPDGVTILTPLDSVIVIAQEPRQEEVVEVAPAAEGAAAPAAEGAAPAGEEKKE